MKKFVFVVLARKKNGKKWGDEIDTKGTRGGGSSKKTCTWKQKSFAVIKRSLKVSLRLCRRWLSSSSVVKLDPAPENSHFPAFFALYSFNSLEMKVWDTSEERCQLFHDVEWAKAEIRWKNETKIKNSLYGNSILSTPLDFYSTDSFEIFDILEFF